MSNRSTPMPASRRILNSASPDRGALLFIADSYAIEAMLGRMQEKNRRKIRLFFDCFAVLWGAGLL